MPQTALEETETNETVIDAPQQKAPAKQEETSEFEIEIVDDIPEEDKGRDSMPEEIVENLEKDELDEYTKEKGKQNKVQRFGKRFSYSPNYGYWTLAPTAAAE